MSTRTQKIAATGWDRARVLIKLAVTSKMEIVGLLLTPGIFLFMASQRSGFVAGTHIKQSLLMVTGGVAMVAAIEGLSSTASMISMDRHDGTMLRLRGTPDGMPAYLVGRMLHICVRAAAAAIVMLIAAHLAFAMPLPSTPLKWATLIWVLVLGILATVPLGATLGALLDSQRASALLQLPVYALVMLSGVFVPFAAMPRYVQWVLEVFPVKWMAQGIRSAMLPDQMLVAETSHSWQRPWVALVLVAWIVAGMWLAPKMLHRAARKESGSKLAGRRQTSIAGGM